MPTVTWAHVDRYTGLLLTTLGTLDDDALAAPSLCAGWSRAHVVAHLAYNADALTRVVAALRAGGASAMYDSDEARDQEIESGATRSAGQQLTHVRDSARQLATAAAELGPEHADRVVPRTPGSDRQVRGGAVPLLRLNEVVLHHIDLLAGFDFEDLDAETADLLLAHALRAHGSDPPLRVRTTEGDEWHLGDDGALVTGSRAAVLAYLTRQLDQGVHVR